MQAIHYVRVGILGHVGRFLSSDRSVYARGQRVICRTPRGLELGEVLSSGESGRSNENDGSLVRAVTVEDDLLLARLEKNRDEAFAACMTKLQENGISATLMDVEHLFDGQSLYFYFLGEINEQIEFITQQLADIYETKVQFREFTDAVERGCGPDCGTEHASGCGDGCSTCSIATACKTNG